MPMAEMTMADLISDLCWDRGDAWGSVMGAAFAIASVLYVRDEDIPEWWEFRAGALTEQTLRGDDAQPDLLVLDLYDSGHITADGLREAGTYLVKLSHELERRGLDY